MKTIENAFRDALASIGTKENNNKTILEKISEIMIPQTSVLTDEELAAKSKEAEERKMAAQIAAVKLLEVEKELKRIESVLGWEEVPELIRNHRQFSGTRQKIVAAGDETFKESLKVARLIAEIVACQNPSSSEVVDYLRRVTEAGRGKLLSQSEADLHRNRNGKEGFHKQTIFFESFCLIPQASEFYSEGISPADKKIFYELGMLVFRYRNQQKKFRQAKMAELMEKGNGNFRQLVSGETGIYRIHFSSRENGRGEKQQEGVGLIEVVNLNEPDKKPFFVVKAIDGTGSLRWMSINKGDWIPFVAIVTGHVLKEKTPASKLEFSQKLARVLNYACRDALRDLRSSQVS